MLKHYRYEIRKIFEYQFRHLISLLILLVAVSWCVTQLPTLLQGNYWNIETGFWFGMAISAPILHQLYVWLIWRLELYLNLFTKRYGYEQAFRLYAVGFSLLFFSRLLTIVVLALSNSGTLKLDPLLAYSIAAIMTPPIIYLFYSVKKYFTIERAYGLDHFDKDFNAPYVKQGIFKYVDNGMYVFGLMVLYLPGLLFFSEAALLVALFNHLYIWAHYFFTERPDMVEIYGKIPMR